MSLEQLVEELEKNPNSQQLGNSLHSHATKEFLEVYRTRDVEDSKGKTKTISQLDVDARTELPSPVSMAVLETMLSWLDDEFGKDASKDLRSFKDFFKIDMISKDRKSREEAKEILTAYASSFGSATELDLGKVNKL